MNFKFFFLAFSVVHGQTEKHDGHTFPTWIISKNEIHNCGEECEGIIVSGSFGETFFLCFSFPKDSIDLITTAVSHDGWDFGVIENRSPEKNTKKFHKQKKNVLGNQIENAPRARFHAPTKSRHVTILFRWSRGDNEKFYHNSNKLIGCDEQRSKRVDLWVKLGESVNNSRLLRHAKMLICVRFSIEKFHFEQLTFVECFKCRLLAWTSMFEWKLKA